MTPSWTFRIGLIALLGVAGACSSSGGGSSSSSSSSSSGNVSSSSGATVSSSAASASGTSSSVAATSAPPGSSSGASPTGETCETAIPVTPGSIPGSTAGAANDYQAFTLNCGENGPGRDRVYSITVPPNTRLDVGLLQGSFGFAYPFVLEIVDGDLGGCADATRTCVAHINGHANAAAPTLSISHTNKTLAARAMYIIVDTGLPDETMPLDDGGVQVIPYETTFTLTVALTAVTPPPGDSCFNAQAITLPFSVSNQDMAGYGDDAVNRTNNCSFWLSPERYYTLTVPASSVLTAHTTHGLNGMSLFQGPADTCLMPWGTCITSADKQTLGTQDMTLTWSNTTAQDAPLFFAADGDGPYDLDISTQALATNDTCDTARVITCAFDGVASCTFANETAVGAANNYQDGPAACGTVSTQFPDVAYRLDLPPMVLASFMVQTSQPGASPTLNLIVGPDAAACGNPNRACVGMGSGSSFLSYQNPTTSVQPVFLIVETGGATRFDVLVH